MQRLPLLFGLVVALAACSSSKNGSTTGGPTGTGTTGGTTSGSDSTVCSPADAGGGQVELTDCNFNVDCSCPADCVADSIRAAILAEGAANPLGKYCEVPCQSNTDCDLPSTVCKGGSCIEVACGALDNVGSTDNFGYPCDALGTNDGTCFGRAVAASDPSGEGETTLTLVPNGLPEACWLGGTAASTCTVSAPPSDASERCGVGATCVPSLPWGFGVTGTCLSTCDPSSSAPAGAPTCASGQSCLELPLIGSGVDLYGVCVTLGDGGCQGGLPTGQSELDGCYGEESCACPEACVPFADAGSGPSLVHSACELPCATSADCPNPATRCNAGRCSYVSCTGTTCAFGDAGAGTCLGASFSWFSTEPFCVQAGTQAAGQSCTYTAPQDVLGSNPYGAFAPLQLPGVPTLSPDQVCAPGLLCVAQPDGGNTCTPGCTSSTTCGDAGLICYPLDPTGYGFCATCGAAATACNIDAGCCSGSCAPSGQCN